MSKRLLVIGTLVCGLALFSVGVARADDIAFSCTGTTSCTSGSVTQVSTGATQTFDFIYHANSGTLTGDGYLGILVPNGTASLTVQVGGSTISLDPEEGSPKLFTSGTLGSLLGENFGNDAYNFNSLGSASAQTGVTAGNFTVYEYFLGTFSSPGKGAAGTGEISVSGAPLGSVLLGWVESPEDPVLDAPAMQTPLSGSITVPEPSASILLGFGLVGLLCVGMIRRRSTGTVA